ncbi:MAG: NrfD/PsrC family molybdoenzyme membrane anchor subunit [Candidatus Kapaibacterium sp.]
MDNTKRFIKDALWFLVFWGIIAAIFRMWFGLGATTNLTDQMPWGLWKILNMIAGVALSTCGFTVGFLVYVLKIERFKPLLRPAILIAFLGYGSSCVALLFDIGLPERFWHPFVMWNEHSFLFEVFWCVILYFTVTFIELIPNILEKYKADRIVKFLHKIAIAAVIIGISLSSLHHSSLGSLFLTAPQRLHELWYSELIPWLFIVSAMAGGMMFLIFVKIIHARLNNPERVFGLHYGKSGALTCVFNERKTANTDKLYGPEMPMLSNLAVIAASLLGIYLLLKIYALFTGGGWHALRAGTWESWLYGFELLIGVVLPIALVIIPRTRRSPYGIGTAAFSASFGLVLNRLDVGIFGFFRDAQQIYFPSLAEWSLSIGVIAAAALLFIYISDNFTIFDDEWKSRNLEKGVFRATFDSFSRVWSTVLHNDIYRISLMAVFVIPVSFIAQYPPFDSPETTKVEPAAGINIERTVLLIDGNSAKMNTTFSHDDHKRRLGGEKSCRTCHHLSMPGDNSTPCYRCHTNMYHRSKIFDHDYHMHAVGSQIELAGLHPENRSCSRCHPTHSAKTGNNAISCTNCHNEDMDMEDHAEKFEFMYADSYMDAMHKNCIGCHEQEEKQIDKNLSSCETCHQNQKINFNINKVAMK